VEKIKAIHGKRAFETQEFLLSFDCVSLTDKRFVILCRLVEIVCTAPQIGKPYLLTVRDTKTKECNNSWD
jgi:hypothetical protein